VRVYAPVGSHNELLPYLVRRLLENGANSSFINQLNDEGLDLDQLVENPCERVQALQCQPHPHIPLPRDLYGAKRRNACGWDLSDPLVVARLDEQLQQACRKTWRASSRVGGEDGDGEVRALRSPADCGQIVGYVTEASADLVDRAMHLAAETAPDWDDLGGRRRGEHLLRAAELFAQDAPRLIASVVREGGRTLADAVAELRETVDYCRYYAAQAEREFERPTECCPDQPANKTNCGCTGAACSPASARGIFRWRFLLGRLPRHSLLETPWWPSQRARRRLPATLRSAFCNGQESQDRYCLAARKRGRDWQPGVVSCRPERGRVDRLDRNRPGNPACPGRTARSHPAADRRDRWPERDDRRQLGPAGTAGG
jgi:hypothetical protein